MVEDMCWLLYTSSLTADQEISDVEDMSQYDLDNPQNTITLTTADGDTSLQIGMESSNNQYLSLIHICISYFRRISCGYLCTAGLS